MDNEDKIRDLEPIKGTSTFLPEGTQKSIDKPQQYEFEKEFGKTKKNRHPLVTLSFLLFIIIIGVSAIAFSIYIQDESKKVTIEIEDFEDVGLQEILDQSARNENNMRRAKRRLEDLNKQMAEEIKSVEDFANQEKELILNRNISDDEKNRLTAEIDRKTDQAIKEIRAKYEPLIAEVQAEINAIQALIDKYDTRFLEQARAQEEVLNSQKRLYEIEKEELIKYYEGRIEELTKQNEEKERQVQEHYTDLIELIKRNHADELWALNEAHTGEVQRLTAEHQNETATLIARYNPVYEDPNLIQILRVYGDSEAAPLVQGALYKLSEQYNILSSEGIASFTEMQQTWKDVLYAAYLLERLMKVPFINSVKPSINSLQSLSGNIVGRYDRILKETESVLTEKNNKIGYESTVVDSMYHAFSHYVQQNNENGFVIDARDDSKILVFIDPLYTVTDGDKGIIFRSDDELIGRVRFEVYERETVAVVEELITDNNPIQPFDKILLQIQ